MTRQNLKILEQFFKEKYNVRRFETLIRKEIMDRTEKVSPQQISRYENVLCQAAQYITNAHPDVQEVVFKSNTIKQNYLLNNQLQVKNLIKDKSFNSAVRYFERALELKTEIVESSFENHPHALSTFILFGFKQRRPLFQELYTFLVIANGFQQILSNSRRNSILKPLKKHEHTLQLDERQIWGKEPAVYIEATYKRLGLFYQTPILGYSGSRHVPDISVAEFHNHIPKRLHLNNVMGIIECKDRDTLNMDLFRGLLGYIIEIVPLFFVLVTTFPIKQGKKKLNPYGIKLIDSMDPLDSPKLNFHGQFYNTILEQVDRQDAYHRLNMRCEMLSGKVSKYNEFRRFMQASRRV